MPDIAEADKEKMLKAVPPDGSAMGNKRLRERLGWDDDRYWKTRDALIAGGKLAIGRGKGGSVRLKLGTTVLEAGEQPTIGEDLPKEAKAAEDSLYPKITDVLREKWSKDEALGDFFVEATAKQGRRTTGGTWTRPDVVVVNVSAYENLPGKHVEVTTFEVKTQDNFDVTAVYEALAHLRAATRAYVLIAVPDDGREQVQDRLEEVREEAARHGVGLIVAADVANYDSWDFRVDAVPKQPDLGRLNEFIDTQVSDANKRKLRKWVK